MEDNTYVDDVGQHVADVCIRAYQLQSLLREYFVGIQTGDPMIAALTAVARLDAMGGLDGDGS